MRQKVLFWALALLLAVAALLRCADDRYVQTYNGFELAGEALASPDGSATLPAGTDAVSTPALWLHPGSYTLILAYEANADGAELRAESERFLNEDNSLGGTLARANLGPEATRLELPLSIEGEVRDLRIWLDAGDAQLTIRQLSVLSGPVLYTDHIWLAGLIVLAAAALYWWLYGRPLPPGHTVQSRLAALAPAAFCLALGLLVSYPLFTSILPMGHDLDFHLARIQGIADGFSGGQFPVRVYPTQLNGKGYLLGVMYPDFFLWPAALLRLGGVSLMGGYKATVLALNLATAGLGYYAGRQFFKTRFAGAVCAVAYTLSVYRVVNVYNRAALGEALAMAFLPLVALGLYKVFCGSGGVAALVIGFSGLVQAHFLTLVEAGAFALLFTLCFLPRLLRQRARLWRLGKAAGLTLLLNLWYLAPFLYFSTQPLKIFSAENFMWQNALDPAQLFMSRAGGGLLHPQMLLTPGLPLLLCAGTLALGLLFGQRGAAALDDEAKQIKAPDATGKTQTLPRVAAACLAFAALALWLCSSWFPWRQVAAIPVIGRLLSSLQFPWRWLSLACALLALCAGALAALWPPKAHRMLVLAALVLAFMLVPANIMDTALNNPDSFTLNQMPNVNHLYDGQYLYEGSNDVMLVAWGNDIKSDDETLAISGYQKQGLKLAFNYSAEAPPVLDLPLVWYPGYSVKDANGQKLESAPNPDGLLRITPQSATGSITVRYTGLWWFRIGDVISLATLCALAVWALRRRTARGKTAGSGKPAGGGVAPA